MTPKQEIQQLNRDTQYIREEREELVSELAERSDDMKRAGYREAIDWIAGNDDTEWLNEVYGSPSVTACLVADLFGVGRDKVEADIRKQLKKYRNDNASLLHGAVTRGLGDFDKL